MVEVVTCPNKPDEGLCLTCRLGGLIRCPSLGTPLPLVEKEKPVVVYRTFDGFSYTSPSFRFRWSGLNDPTKW